MNMNRHIWEGWTPQDFVNDLEPTFDMIMRNRSHTKAMKKDELKTWLQDNQPYYKKHSPEVYQYFLNKMEAMQ
jgi:hypothetical protein